MPVRWCGMARANSVKNPGILGLDSADELLNWRSEQAAKRFLNGTDWQINLRSALPTYAEYRNADTFPLLYLDSRACEARIKADGEPFNLDRLEECDRVVLSIKRWTLERECRDAWEQGDALFFDVDNDRQLSERDVALSRSESDLQKCRESILHDECKKTYMASSEYQKIPLVSLFEKERGVYGYLDCLGSENSLGKYDPGEPIYRDQDGDGVISAGDILISPVPASGAKSQANRYTDKPQTDCERDLRKNAADAKRTFVPRLNFLDEDRDDDPFERVRFLDRIPLPHRTFSIGFAQRHFWGVYAISTQDVESNGGSTDTLGFMLQRGGDKVTNCRPGTVLLDDPTLFLPEFPDVEKWVVAHEFAHAIGLPHGDGIDQNDDKTIDDADEENGCRVCDPPSSEDNCIWVNDPDCGVELTKCERENVMQYCWKTDTEGEKPSYTWVGRPVAEEGEVVIGPLQADRMFARVACCRGPFETGADKECLEQQERFEFSDHPGELEEERWWRDIQEAGFSQGNRRIAAAWSELEEPSGPVAKTEFFTTFRRPPGNKNPGIELLIALDSDVRDDTGIPLSQLGGAWSKDLFRNVDLVIRATFEKEGAGTLRVQRFGEAGEEPVELEIPGATALLTPLRHDPRFSDGATYEDPPFGDMVEIVFEQGTFPFHLSDRTSMVVSSRGLEDEEWSDRLEAEAARDTEALKDEFPPCRFLSLEDPSGTGGQVLEALPRGTSVLVEAEGLLPHKLVDVEINGGSPIPGKRTNSLGLARFMIEVDHVRAMGNGRGDRVQIEVSTGGYIAICEAPVIDKEPITTPQSCGLDWSCAQPGRCKKGNFKYVPSCSDKPCIDGSPKFNGACPVPLAGDGTANCINSADNVYRLAAPGVTGLVYNRDPRHADGSMCCPYFHNVPGPPLCSSKYLQELCLADQDVDGIPDVHDPCPSDVGITCGESTESME